MPPTRREGQPWYASANLDFFVKIANNTVFHPFICWMIPLCLRAGETPWEEDVMRNTIAWASLVTLQWAILQVTDRLAYGEPREVDSEEEVVVVTGGSSGLGRCIAEVYAMKGASVAVLDKQPADPDMVLENVEYYDCNITDRKAVDSCWKQINKDIGTPTILINNAGIVNGKKLMDLQAEEVNETFQTNIVAQYHLNQLFLAPLRADSGETQRGGTLVTISSVLGRVGAAQLSDYSASKAGEWAMHQSLAAELAVSHPHIKTILVAPGQLSTELFGGLRMAGILARFCAPLVEVSELAIKIVQMVNAGRGGFIAEPFYARWIGLLDLLPPGLQVLIRRVVGLDSAMGSFRTRSERQEEERNEKEHRIKAKVAKVTKISPGSPTTGEKEKGKGEDGSDDSVELL